MMIVGGLQGTETSDSMPKAPTDLDAGFVAHTAGRLSEARRWYEQALALEPGNCRALFLLGTLHAAENRTARAIAFFEKCIGLHPSLSIAHNALGNALHAAREIPRAAAEYRRAIDCPEPCVEAFCNLGAICRSLGQLDEAVSLYRRALVIQPDLVQSRGRVEGAETIG
jgi:tetratricopeptide (TPR) repeat protein